MTPRALNEIRFTLDRYAEYRRELDERRKNNNGLLPRSEWWRFNYFKNPYLAGATKEYIEERFCDVFFNNMDLNKDCQLVPRPSTNDDFVFMKKFAELTIELGSRGGMPSYLAEEARTPLLNYLDSKHQSITAALKAIKAPSKPVFAKYSKKEFLRPMLSEGSLRICPASYYDADSHNKAIKDLETTREFYIPTFSQRLRGESNFLLDGNAIFFGEFDHKVRIVADDYYLFSLCNDLFYRLPIDFNADAVMIIHDRNRFSQRLISAFLANDPGWKPTARDVTYYDPYRDYSSATHPSQLKHLKYAYQREFRITFTQGSEISAKLAPIFLNIGPMKDYAEIIEL